MPTSISLKHIVELIDKVYPPLYYGLITDIDPGSLFYIQESGINPEYIVCHPDDLETLKGMITARRLVPIKDEPIEKVYDRIIKHTKLVFDEGLKKEESADRVLSQILRRIDSKYAEDHKNDYFNTSAS